MPGFYSNLLGQEQNNQYLGSIHAPLMTGIDPKKEGRYQQFKATHQNMFTEPVRDVAGNLIPASLYDMRGDIYSGDTGTINPQDMQPHFDSRFKMPGFQEVEQNIGISGPDESATFAQIMPQNTGSWHGSDNGGWYYAAPVQQINPNTFYPTSFGKPTNYPSRPALNPLQGNVINGLIGGF